MSQLPHEIAICGIGCRFAGGVHDSESLWKLLIEGRDAITEIPRERWTAEAFYHPDPAHMGMTNSKWGGFVDGIDRFDPAFFGISEREAGYIDPQQRLLLEAVWESIEDAGFVLEKIRRFSPGVFVGIATIDYATMHVTPVGAGRGSPYAVTGTSHSIAANRISYSLDFDGPSYAIDTACSSSLIAVHLACESLIRGECRMAFAGGVNSLLLPSTFIGLSNMSALAPDGRCKAFDARANGFARGEGVGMVALRPLEDALAEGDRIYGVILATGTNQDGSTAGLAHPSGDAQVAVVKGTLERAGVDPRAVRYVEAHGTGTAVGDVVEATSLGHSIGLGLEREDACLIGSIKTNVGHLEAGAGIAGLIKCALILQRGLIPASLHFETPNPKIDFETLGLRVAANAEPLPGFGEPGDGPVVGINSFGFGGSNAFALLRGMPSAAPRKAALESVRLEEGDKGWYLLPLSARSSEALPAQAESFAAYLETEGSQRSLGRICDAAATRRTHHRHRLTVAASSRRELVERLRAFAASEDGIAGTSSGEIWGEARPVFIFSGQGAQWYAMGRELYQNERVYRERLEACHEALLSDGGWSLIDELMKDEEASRLSDTTFAQPAIFAVQVAQTALWESWGVRPAAVVGHSVGEVAAAHVAGALDLDQAIRVIHHRGRCMGHAVRGGGMLAAGLTAEEALELIEPYGEILSLASVNGPLSVAISGERRALEELDAELERMERFHKFVPVEYAFHSAEMEPAREELLAALVGIEPSPAEIPIVSTVTGKETTGTLFDAAYWWRNVRETVQFGPAIQTLISSGYRVFVENAAHPVLGASIRQTVEEEIEDSAGGAVIATLRREADGQEAMLEALGALHCLGHPVDWSTFHSGAGDSLPVDLPKYAWQRKRYWEEVTLWKRSRLRPCDHRFQGWRIDDPLPTWHFGIDRRILSYFNDHRVAGRIVLPAAAFIEMAAVSAGEVLPDGPFQVEDLVLAEPLVFQDTGDDPVVQLQFDPRDRTLTYCGLINEEDPWLLHARGRLESVSPQSHPTRLDLERIRERCRERRIGAGELYPLLQESGLDYGKLFQGVAEIRGGNKEAIGRIRLPRRLRSDFHRYLAHPVLVDSAFHVTSAVFPADKSQLERPVFMPVSIGRVRFFEMLPEELWVHAKIASVSENSLAFDLALTDGAGNVVMEIRRFRCEALRATVEQESGLKPFLYETAWKWKALSGTCGCRNPSPPAAFLPDLGALSKRRHKRPADPKILSGIPELQKSFDQLCGCHLRIAFDELGWNPKAGVRVSTASLMKESGVAPRYRPLVDRALNWLAEDGILVSDAAGGENVWRAVGPIRDEGNAAALTRTALELGPPYFADILLLNELGERLADILRGHVDWEELSRDAQTKALHDQLLAGSMCVREANFFLADTIGELVSRFPQGRVVRVLEVDGGVGGMTGTLLSLLPKERCQYVFADGNKHRVAEARARYSADHDFMSFVAADLTSEAAFAEWPSGSFDLVVGADVFRRKRELPGCLKLIRKLLAPGGIFLAGVGDVDSRAHALISLLTDDRWSDGGKVATRDEWHRQLLEAGFEAVESLGGLRSDSRWERALFAAKQSKGVVSGPPRVEEKGRWLVLADHGGMGERLADELVRRGGEVSLCRLGEEPAADAGGEELQVTPGDQDRLERITREFVSSGGCRGVVHLWSLDAPRGESVTVEEMADSRQASCHGVLPVLRGLAEDDTSANRPSLSLVTQNAQTGLADSEPISVAQAPLLGLGRVIAMEMPSMQCRRIDLPQEVSDRVVAALADELIQSEDSEDEIALRGEGRYVQRVQAACVYDKAVALRWSGDYRLEIVTAGALDGMVFRPLERIEPGEGEIEIEVRAAGLNFRDVMKALGIYPRESPDASILGDECAGVVKRVGSGVDHFKPGDRVVAWVSGCFGTHVTTPAALTLALPEELGFEDGATMLVNYSTAYYALQIIGGMTAGERVLIHAGAGGVGLAAVNLALAAGAEVFATAGNPVKRKFLQNCGVHHVLDSRTLDFADEIEAITGGAGIDLVLNSLAGRALEKSLEVLGQNGRFLEIGKRDIHGDTKIGLGPFRKGISFHAIDLAEVLRGAKGETIFSGIGDLLARGGIRPLPYRAFSLVRAPEAFRCMAQAMHIGKIILNVDGARPEVLPQASSTPLFLRPDASYLITGGLRGLGLSLANWCARRGARYLILTNRSGVSHDEAREGVAHLESLGVKVMAEGSDVADPDELASLLNRAAETMPPLKGIIHGAAALDDRTLLQMDAEMFETAMRPKASGAWNLHQQTRDLPLDFFLMMSSISAILGTPGQGNYAAANAFQDALSHYRRGIGLRATSINWDMVKDVGMAARDEATRQRFEKIGWKGLSPEQVELCVERLLMNYVDQMCVTTVDWPRFLSQPGLAPDSPRFDLLRGGEDDREAGGNIRLALISAIPDQRPAMIEEFLKQQIADMTRVPPQKIDAESQLDRLGIDSLMGVELLVRIERQIGVAVRASHLMKKPTISGIAEAIAERVDSDGAEDSSSNDGAGAAISSRDRFPEDPSESEADQFLADSITLEIIRPESLLPGSPRRLFLTGATGYLGSRLLRELLCGTEAEIHCLVRADDERRGKERLLAGLRENGLDADEQQAERVRCVNGDLELPGFGLEREALENLPNSMDAIYHAGATVNHIQTYESLRSANVLGTLEVLKLSAAGRGIPLHLISSVAVFGLAFADQDRVFSEADAPVRGSIPDNGYIESKRVAEEIAWKLKNRGLPLSIYRLGLLVGDRETKRVNPDDLLWRAVQACILCGAAPELGGNLYLAPVDDSAKAVVWLSTHQPPGNRYHLVGAEPVTFNDIVDAANAYGYPVQRTSGDEWLQRLQELGRTQGAHPLTPYLDFFPTEWILSFFSRMATFNSEASLELLEPSSIRLSGLAGDYLEGCLDQLVRETALPPPSRTRVPVA